MNLARTDTYDDRHDGALRQFSGDDTEVAFPLGGIGTGNVWLGSRGQLTDWELFNRPGKGNDLPYTFFALRCADEDGDSAVTRVLESRLRPPFHGSGGLPSGAAAGLPRFEETTFTGTYPTASVAFEDDSVPVAVSLEAYTPFVPLAPEDSGIPVAVLEYTVENPTDRSVEVSVFGSATNPVGQFGDDPGRSVTGIREGESLTGLAFGAPDRDPSSLGYRELALAVEPGGMAVDHTAAWPREPERKWDAFGEVWRTFLEDGRLPESGYETPSAAGAADTGSLSVTAALAPGESRTVRYLVGWYVPNRRHGWEQSPSDGDSVCCAGERADGEVVRNRYATRFESAWDVVASTSAQIKRLRGDTYAFRDAFFGSPLPGYVLEAVSSQLAVARSQTCFWLADGSFLAYEGCRETGCCSGTCTHVWNYAQSLAALFPSLEREMRRIDFAESTGDSGYMPYRTPLPVPEEVSMAEFDDHPAADGQFGTVLRLYREWQYSGDDGFLEGLWPHARRALEFAFEYEQWDPDEDGVLEGSQHNTYDIEYYGPNPLSQTWYLGALRAGAEMARAVGDDGAARRYERVYESGRARTEELFNGEYYEQAIDDPEEHPYQVGRGCLSDQVIGQWYADMLGLGDLLPPEQVDSALDAVYEHNFERDLSGHHNTQRTYALGEESGLLLCTWPRGEKPTYPTRFGEEVWTGIEYQVASHLIYRGRVEEGLELVRAVRERHDGRRRNPFNEFECGDHYARAMSSWAVYRALAGLHVDRREGAAGVNERGFRLDPVLDDDGEYFWITGDAWGTATPNGDVTVCRER